MVSYELFISALRKQVWRQLNNITYKIASSILGFAFDKKQINALNISENLFQLFASKVLSTFSFLQHGLIKVVDMA